MGMYNEVYKRCPECGGEGYMQIPQLVLGFGGFNLDNPERLAEDLTVDQMHKLKSMVVDRYFTCQNEACEHTFNPYRVDVARELFQC